MIQCVVNPNGQIHSMVYTMIQTKLQLSKPQQTIIIIVKSAVPIGGGFKSSRRT